jgi:hypothetical protein
MPNPSSDQTCSVKVDRKYDFFVRVCHGRFHDILPNEYSGKSFIRSLFEKKNYNVATL